MSRCSAARVKGAVSTAPSSAPLRYSLVRVEARQPVVRQSFVDTDALRRAELQHALQQSTAAAPAASNLAGEFVQP
jgi:hypothetical protein